MKTFLAGMAFFVSTATFACGYCLEDKIAATYDHAVIKRAAGQKHEVAFFHVEGTAPRQALEQAVHAAPGVDRGSTRVAADLATVSFAFDPARASLAAIQSRVEKKLAPYKLTLMPLQVIR